MVDGDRTYRGSRVFYPHKHWQTLDFVLGAIALGCLALALQGLATAVTALHDVDSIQRECPFDDCVLRGAVTATATYGTNTAHFCTVTMKLGDSSRQAWLAGTVCRQIPVGSAVDATTWRGKIVIVKTAVGTFGTADNPGAGVGVGVFRMLAFAPFLLLLAMIHVDVANHRVVRHLRSRLSVT